MNDRELLSLIRMAMDAAELEVDRPERAPLFVRSTRSRTLVTCLVAGAAAAAIFVLSPRPAATPVEARPALALEYCPSDDTQAPRIEHFGPRTEQFGLVVALLREWRGECQCLAWRVYEWADGRAITAIDPSDDLDIALDVSGAPPVEQFVVVAMSPHSGGLPVNRAEAEDLVACLNEQDYNADAEQLAHSESMVAFCLPDDVEIVARRFLID